MVKNFWQRGHIWSPRRTRCSFDRARSSVRLASSPRLGVNLHLLLQFYTRCRLCRRAYDGEVGEICARDTRSRKRMSGLPRWGTSPRPRLARADRPATGCSSGGPLGLLALPLSRLLPLVAIRLRRVCACQGVLAATQAGRRLDRQWCDDKFVYGGSCLRSSGVAVILSLLRGMPARHSPKGELARRPRVCQVSVRSMLRCDLPHRPRFGGVCVAVRVPAGTSRQAMAATEERPS
jgi:hypothetical protein